MFGLGAPEIALIIVALVVLFGGRKIPELMRGIGEGMREFRKASTEAQTEIKRMVEEPVEEHKTTKVVDAEVAETSDEAAEEGAS